MWGMTLWYAKQTCLCQKRHMKETCMCQKKSTKETCICQKRHTKGTHSLFKRNFGMWVSFDKYKSLLTPACRFWVPFDKDIQKGPTGSLDEIFLYGSHLTHTGLFWHIQISSGTYRPLLTHTGLFWHKLVSFGTYRSLLTHTGLFWHIQVAFDYRSLLGAFWQRHTKKTHSLSRPNFRMWVSLDTYRSLLTHTGLFWVPFDRDIRKKHTHWLDVCGSLLTHTGRFWDKLRPKHTKETRSPSRPHFRSWGTTKHVKRDHCNTLQHTCNTPATHKYGIELYYSVNSKWLHTTASIQSDFMTSHKYLSAAPNCRQTCMHEKTFTQNQTPLGT